ncbi:hypothetical protein AB0C93_19815 [Streptomyces sp. NPDC048518]|uniref:hypothetical protein n=1 Tax=Streptomyces sp. NPDC048518 TaxID=3155029 RepID=UPI0033F97C53
MDLRSVDPRDITWEQDHATYRVYFWDRSTGWAHEYEVSGAGDVDGIGGDGGGGEGGVDVGELLAWTKAHAAERGWLYTLYVVTADDGRRGLIRLAGVLGDPFTAITDVEK